MELFPDDTVTFLVFVIYNLLAGIDGKLTILDHNWNGFGAKEGRNCYGLLGSRNGVYSFKWHGIQCEYMPLSTTMTWSP